MRSLSLVLICGVATSSVSSSVPEMFDTITPSDISDLHSDSHEDFPYGMYAASVGYDHIHEYVDSLSAQEPAFNYAGESDVSEFGPREWGFVRMLRWFRLNEPRFFRSMCGFERSGSTEYSYGFSYNIRARAGFYIFQRAKTELAEAFPCAMLAAESMIPIPQEYPLPDNRQEDGSYYCPCNDESGGLPCRGTVPREWSSTFEKALKLDRLIPPL